jgi:hypothetical protein
MQQFIGWFAPGAPGHLWVLVLLISLTGAGGDLCMDRWARTSEHRWFVVASAVWLANLWLLGWLLKTDSRSLSRLLMLIIIGHLLLVLAWELVHQRIRPTLNESLGMVLGIVVVILLEWHGPRQVSSQPPPQPSVTGSVTAESYDP